MLCDKCVPVGGGVAVNGGDHHGGAVFGWNLYRDPRRLMYRAGVLLEKLSTFRTMHNMFRHVTLSNKNQQSTVHQQVVLCDDTSQDIVVHLGCGDMPRCGNDVMWMLGLLLVGCFSFYFSHNVHKGATTFFLSCSCFFPLGEIKNNDSPVCLMGCC